jgi:hypothetical protein
LPHEARGALLGDLTFHTQASTEADGRPDLAGVDEHGKTQLLVEVKFWAGFTEKQPVAYLDQLPENGVLLVVGPQVRLQRLWAELGRRLREAKREYIERANVGVGCDAHLVVGGRHLVLASWQRILHAIKTEAHGEPAVVADVDQLLGLCQRQDDEAFIPLTSEELTSAVYRRVHEFGRVVDDVAQKLAGEGLVRERPAGC